MVDIFENWLRRKFFNKGLTAKKTKNERTARHRLCSIIFGNSAKF